MITALALAAATAVLPVVTLPAVAEPATAAMAAPMGATACPGTTGVTVVVDFGSHGSTVVRCAKGDPTSAAAALERAGFAQVPVQMQAFLCRIDGVPAPTEDACMMTPPATAYWALWSASRGGAWTFANVGVYMFDPKPGSVVGFAFGDGDRPRVDPPTPAPAPRSSTPRLTTRPTTTAGDATVSPTAGTAPATATSRPSATPASPATGPGSPAPTASASSSTATASPALSSPASLAATPTAGRAADSAGGSVGAWVGIGVVALVGTAAWTRALQRRRR